MSRSNPGSPHSTRPVPPVFCWWLHAEVDVEHRGQALAMLEKHCTTRETQDMALHWAREGARMKYLFWDGINLHYERGYRLQ